MKRNNGRYKHLCNGAGNHEVTATCGWLSSALQREAGGPAFPPHGVTTSTDERAEDRPGNRGAKIHPPALRRRRRHRRLNAELTDLPSAVFFTGQVEGGKASTNAA